MKIVTVNIPESFVDAIEKLIGEDGLYPSRSELIRCAVREFLVKELTLAKKMALHNEGVPDNFKDFDLDNDKFVRIPMETRDESNEPKREFKTYKIIKKTEPKAISKPKKALKPSTRVVKAKESNDTIKIPTRKKDDEVYTYKCKACEHVIESQEEGNFQCPLCDVVRNKRVGMNFNGITPKKAEPKTEFKTYKIVRRLEH